MSAVAFLKSSPDESKFPDINVLLHLSASKPEEPAEPHVFSIVSQPLLNQYCRILQDVRFEFLLLHVNHWMLQMI